MAYTPLHLPDGVSLPAVILASLLVAGLIARFSRKPPPVARPAAPLPASPLEATILTARDALARDLSARLGFAIRPTHYGAVDISPAHLVIWLIVDRDSQRDQIRALPDFDATCRAALAAAGYPAQAVPLAQFGVESEETVQRDWAGNWWHYFK